MHALWCGCMKYSQFFVTSCFLSILLAHIWYNIISRLTPDIYIIENKQNIRTLHKPHQNTPMHNKH
jgi:hypothetical protein